MAGVDQRDLRRCASSGQGSALSGLFWAISPAILQWCRTSRPVLLRSPSSWSLWVRLAWRLLQVLLDAPARLCAPQPWMNTTRPGSSGDTSASSPVCRATTMNTSSLFCSLPFPFIGNGVVFVFKNELNPAAILLQLRL